MIVNAASGQSISYDGQPMPAWGLGVSMQGTDTSRRWTFEPDTTLRFSSNNACLEVDPKNGAIGLVACNGSRQPEGLVLPGQRPDHSQELEPGRLHRPWAFAALFELFAHAELRRHVPRGQGVAVGAQPALTRHGRGARRGSGRVIYAP